MTAVEITLVVLIVAVFIMVASLFFLIPAIRKSIASGIRSRFRISKSETIKEIKNLAEQLSDVLIRLARDKIGALITIERKEPLGEYVQIGFEVVCKFSPELVYSIFYNKISPLHDGAIIVKDSQIVSVSSYFPTSKQNIDINYGARHRAALGISEITDAATFVVSESYGRITVARSGKLIILPDTPQLLKAAILENLLASRTGV